MKGSIAVAAGFVLLASACGSAPATQQQHGALAFAGCMRSNGVTKYPDPANGRLAKASLQQLGVSSARFQSAQAACRHLLPNGGLPASQTARQRIRAQGLEFARCVRSHGVPSFPDPASDGRIPDPASVGIDQGSPKFEAANQACGEYRPPYMPSNSAYNAYARTQ
jgi:hypothetical protein